jgi:hypothetical protein
MAAIHLREQVVFRAPTRVGLLADVTDRLVAKGVNVLAIRGYDEAGGMGVLIIFPDDSRLAIEALETLDGDVGTMPMLVAELPNAPGELAEIARALVNANLNVSQIHATASADCDRMLVMLETSNDVAAMDALLQL